MAGRLLPWMRSPWSVTPLSEPRKKPSLPQPASSDESTRAPELLVMTRQMMAEFRTTAFRRVKPDTLWTSIAPT